MRRISRKLKSISRKTRRLFAEILEPRLLLSVTPAKLPVLQNFDSLPGESDGWEYASTNDGRVEVVNNRLRMDDSVDGVSYSENKAIVHLDLEGESGVIVEGKHFSLSDESHSKDGLFARIGDGEWNKLYSWGGNGRFEIDLDSAIAKANLQYTSDFQLAFQQYDNWSATYDGRELDDIRIWSPPPPTPQQISSGNPYVQTFDAMPEASDGWTYASTNDGRIEITNDRLRMDDSVDGVSYSLNSATLHVQIDSTQEQRVILTGDHWNLSDEKHDKDGVFIFDGSWTRHYVSSGKFNIDLSSNVTEIKFQQYDNWSATLDGVDWDNLKIEVIDPPTPQQVSFGNPYAQAFDTMPQSADGWEYVTTNDGNTEVANGRLRMDDSVNGGSYSLNSAILHVQLDVPFGHKSVLTGDHWNLSDEKHDEDGVFIFDGSWTRHYVSSGNFSIDLSSDVTKVKFQQYDNYGEGKDGREWDNINIEVVPPPTPQVVSSGNPYVQTFDTMPSASDGWAYESTNDGRIKIVDGKLQMDDAVNGGSYSLNEAILHVSLQVGSTQEARLSGTIKDINDEEHTEDGVFVSKDGVTWTKLVQAGGSFDTTISSDVIFVKLAQYDNYGASDDGRAYDNITVEVWDYSDPMPWPVDLGFYKDVFVYGGIGATSRTLYAADSLGLTKQDLLTSSGSTSRAVINGSSSDLNGALVFPDEQPRFRHVFQNGGNATDQAVALGKAGKLVYQLYVTNGGTFSGSCAGMFVAGDGYWELVPKGFALSGYSSTTHSVSFDADDGRFYEILVEQGVTDGIIHSIGHYGGPYVRDLATDDPRIEKLGYVYNVGGRLGGTPYLVAFKANEKAGRVVPQPSHPEISRSGDKLRLMESIVLYAMEGGRKIPDLKGTLSPGGLVTMDADNTKVGDGQYHRYTIDVESGTDKLDLSLYDLSGNADIYVQYDSPANERSYLAKSTNTGKSVESIRIDNPAAGTWHVSVHGAHEIKNGVAYTLAATEAPPAPPAPSCDYDLAALNSQVQAIYNRYGFTGTVIATACDQQVFLDSKGRADDSSYSLASVSKHFTAAGIMKLQEMGKLSVTDRYSDHIPGGSSATLHQLMTHTRYGSYNYSNQGYAMLYNVINRITGDARGFMQTEFLDKAGMTNSTSRYWMGQGGMYTTAEDMAKWDRAFNTGVVLTQASVDAMRTQHVSNGYGYGLRNGTTSGDLYSHHSGSYDNYISYYYMYDKDAGTKDDDMMWLILTRGGVSYGFVRDMHAVFGAA